MSTAGGREVRGHMAFRSGGFGGGYGGGGGGFGFGFALTPWVKRLLIANAVVFLVTAISGTAFLLLALVPSQVLLRPWTPLTYMFVHGGFLHLFFNLLVLFFFGPALEERWGSRAFIRFYLLCGLGAAAASFLFAFNAAVIGASGAVYGVMLAFAMLWPHMPIYIWGIFPVKAMWLVAFLFLLSVFGAVSGPGDGVAHFAHLGGFAAAFLYMKFGGGTTAWGDGGASGWGAGTRAGRGGYGSGAGGGRAGDPRSRESGFSRLRRRLTGPKLTVEPGGGDRPRAPRRTGADEERLLREVDRVLDKINESGIGSLTPEERRVLDEMSRRQRKD
jgi:membrane associated rhomboid family serine protease